LCPTTNALIVGTVTNNVTGLTYLWVGTGVPPGSTDTFYTTVWSPIPDVYGIWFIVTASNGCRAQSNSIIFHDLDSCGVPGTGTDTGGTSGGGCPTLFSATYVCRELELNALTTGITGTWHAETPPPAGPLPPLTNPVYCTYNEPGIYKFNFLGGYTGCHADTVIADTLGIIPDFRWELQCGTGGFDSVFLMDLTAYLPWWHIDSIAWYDGAVRIGGGSNLGLSLAAPGSFTFTEHVYGTDPTGLFACDTAHTINLPGTPSAAFTDAVSPICEGIPINFTPTSPTGIVNYNWNFGDSSHILISNPQRTYTWGGGGNPEHFIAKLVVTDSIGCTATTSQTVLIYDNLLNGNLGAQYQSICSSDAPLMLNYINLGTSIPNLYNWSDGVSNTTGIDYVNVSGAYWVTVFDAHQCQKTLPDPVKEVRIIKPPIPSISGKQVYCVPDAVQLSGYLGSGVTYNWVRNGSSIGVTTPALNDPSLSAGDYDYQLVIGAFDSTLGTTCYESSAVYTIHMYPPPPVPTITGPTILDCATYQIQLSASDVEMGYFNWSDGHYGADDTINSGGPYRVWFTDMNGCVSHTDVGVPLSPETYFQYFPSGCYNICTQQLPLLLYGPPDDTFNYWAWMYDDIDTVISGSGLMLPYNITSAGSYQWTLDNGLCTKTSDEMDVTLNECNGCKQTRLSAVATCTSGNPASYSIVVNFNSPGSGSTYTLGTDIGPIDPFSGTLGGGFYSLTLTFTTLVVPPPDSITVEILFRLHDGSKCFQKIRIPLDTCMWIEERQAHAHDSIKNGGHISLQSDIANALLVFPNPSSGDVTASYEYGTDGSANRSLTVYDAVGRKMASTAPQDSHGNWIINTNNWSAGIYIIQMAADGRALQTQRFVITGH
jgi:hypothetical protein